MTIQGSVEWLNERCGKVTASRVADMLAKTKAGWGASRANYAAQLVAERLTGVPAESFKSAAMEWGSATESEAKAAYSFYTGRDVEDVGFIPHPRIAMAGASPDGFVLGDGLIEVKCPNTSTHIDTLLNASIPGKYEYQMAWQMACTGRAWCDWVSYDPRVPESMRLFIKRMHRHDPAIAELEQRVSEFLAEVDDTVARLRAAYETQAEVAA